MPDSRGGRNGRGRFLPGVSGNPGGNPRQAGFAARIRAATADGQDLVDFALRTMRGEMVSPVLDSAGAAIGVTQAHVSDAVRMQACMWLSDRAFGKVPSLVDTEENPLAGHSEADALRQIIDALEPPLRKVALEYLVQKDSGAPQ